MNAARVAQALRDLADAIEDEDAGERPTRSAPRERKRRLPPAPASVSDTDRAFAARLLRDKGFRKVEQ